MARKVELLVRSFSETDSSVRNILTNGGNGTARLNGMLYFLAGGQVYSCIDTPEGRNLLETAAAWNKPDQPIRTEEQILQDVLTGASDASVLYGIGFTSRVPRCVVLFRSLHPGKALSRETIPVETADRIVIMGNGDLAVIMQTERRSAEDVYEFTSAAVGTMEIEAGIACSAGIGRISEKCETLADSYRDAREALETGLRHKLPGNVFTYEKQILERLADMIPAESAKEFRRKILPPESDKLLTPEILETIQVFFQNDLNLSTTARQMYIHRNTLLYRMEKIRKEIGLDLRKFEDAVVFRMMMSLVDKQ